MDLVHDQLALGSKIRVLTVVHIFSKFLPLIDSKFSYRAEDVVRTLEDESLLALIRRSLLGSDRTYGARWVWHDVLAEGINCGLHRIERLMRANAMKAPPRRRQLPPDTGERVAAAIAPNVKDRQFHAT